MHMLHWLCISLQVDDLTAYSAVLVKFQAHVLSSAPADSTLEMSVCTYTAVTGVLFPLQHCH